MTAEEYYNNGISKYELGDFVGAIVDFDKTIELHPFIPAAYNNRGMAKEEVYDYQGALADYDKAIRLDPNYVKAYNNRGNVKDHLKDYDAALADFNKAIELKPNYDKAYFNRGYLKHRLNDYNGAISDYTIAIGINPNYEKAYINREKAKQQISTYAPLLKDGEEIVLYTAPCFFQTGNSKMAKSDFSGAIADFDLAIMFYPNYAEAYCGRGIAKLNTGQMDGACFDFHKAKDLGFIEADTFIRQFCK